MRLMPGEPEICAACDTFIMSMPVWHTGIPYCCEGCSAGGPCTCTYDADDGHKADADAVDALGLPFRSLPVTPGYEPAIASDRSGHLAGRRKVEAGVQR